MEPGYNYAAKADAALMDGHVNLGAVVQVREQAAKADAALMDGHRPGVS